MKIASGAARALASAVLVLAATGCAIKPSATEPAVVYMTRAGMR